MHPRLYLVVTNNQLGIDLAIWLMQLVGAAIIYRQISNT